MLRGMDDHSGGKKIRLAVITFIATIIIALCTLCTEMEDNMANTTITCNSIEANTVDTSANHPSP